MLAVAALVGVEALVLIGLGVYVGVRGLIGGAASRGNAELLAGMAVLTGGGLLVVASGLKRARRWARTPAALTQVFALVVAWEPLRANPAWRYPMLVFAVAALVLLVVRPTSDALKD